MNPDAEHSEQQGLVYARSTNYRTDASIVPPFFHVKFVLKWGVGLYTGTKSNKKFSKS